ncbi:MAG: hypothetical protein KDJ52_13620 [Anaerolineae bacterium]|nr:hypothetical protein [Anaerolineae bacterium]
MKELPLPGNAGRRRGVMMLGVIWLVPTLLAAAILAMAPVVNGAITDEPAAIEFATDLEDDLGIINQTSAAAPLISDNKFDWPLDQVAIGIGIFLVVTIGLPLGYRVTKNK